MKVYKEQRAEQIGDYYLASTPDLDHDNDRLLLESWAGDALDGFKLNPAMPFAHRYDDPFLLTGEAEDVRVTMRGLEVKPKLRAAVTPEDPQHAILSLVKNKLLRGLSVGFVPQQWRDNPEGGRDFTKVKLLEVSWVILPANPFALSTMSAKGIGDVLRHKLRSADVRQAWKDLLWELYLKDPALFREDWDSGQRIRETSRMIERVYPL